MIIYLCKVMRRKYLSNNIKDLTFTVSTQILLACPRSEPSSYNFKIRIFKSINQ